MSHLSRSMVLAALFFFAGCSTVPVVQSAPSADEAFLSIHKSLDHASALTADRDPAAVAAWADAYDVFERQLEPALRAQYGAAEVAAIELAFGQLRRSMIKHQKDDQLADPQRLIRELSQQLDALVNDLPPSTVASR